MNTIASLHSSSLVKAVPSLPVITSAILSERYTSYPPLSLALLLLPVRLAELLVSVALPLPSLCSSSGRSP